MATAVLPSGDSSLGGATHPEQMSDTDTMESLAAVLEQYWGFDSFRPLQLEAMKCVMRDQDSLIVFPTGGGKSLCFQAPAMCRDGIAVVVSPLISLMKDQVDALTTCGIPAACLNSSVTGQERQQIMAQLAKGELRLLYLAPERLLMEQTIELLQSMNVSFFAIDEAHCVSEWGHDFRPDYRGLSKLKQLFPNVAIHAYTATATEQVRQDIVRQLGLQNTEPLVGPMDRPNLTYQIRRRSPGLSQIAAVLEAHKSESGIIYCISRKDVDSTSAALNGMGFNTLPYHAGMSAEDRKKSQDAFLKEEVDTIVATVAFGMGIDKSNVRYVIHAAMPKSLEGYQQESGRAGRDGLEAECWTFFNGGDFVTWKRLLGQSGSEQGRTGAIQTLNAINDFCNGVNCRHATLASYFGQTLEVADCGACDVCLGEIDLVDDALVIGQKILSCVARVEQRFGADYVAKVLIGSEEERILQNKHDQLSTHGLMSETDKRAIRAWIDQLVSQSFLAKVGEYNVLQITASGNELLRGNVTPRLMKPSESHGTAKRAKSTTESWAGVDRGLFEALKALRSAKSRERSVPAYVVFSDNSLRDMARRRPSTLEAFGMVNGVGQQKLADFGEEFLAAIREFSAENGLEVDIKNAESPAPPKSRSVSKSAADSFQYFDEGKSVAEVAKIMSRAESTTRGYLSNYIEAREITDPTQWVDAAAVAAVRDVVLEVGMGPLKPIYVALDEKVSYDEIRIVLHCLANADGG